MRRWFFVVALILVFVPPALRAEGHLEVVLEPAKDARKAESGVITFTMKNTGDQPVYVLEQTTPFADLAGRLPNNIFRVSGEGAGAADYKGVMANFGPVTNELFEAVYPGEVRSKEVDLSKDYDLSPGGKYRVDYTLYLGYMPDEWMVSGLEVKENAQNYIHANTLEIYVNANLVAAGSRIQSVKDEYPVCNAATLGTLNGLLSLATSKAYDALQAHGRQYELSLDPEGYPVLNFNSLLACRNFFGSYDTSVDWMNPFSDNSVVDQVTAAIYYRLSQKTISFTCGCDGFREHTRATAQTASPYLIRVCDSFFRLSRRGQINALIHEISHFSDEAAQSTGDYVYTRREAMRLATFGRPLAVRNGDNYEFYENDITY